MLHIQPRNNGCSSLRFLWSQITPENNLRKLCALFSYNSFLLHIRNMKRIRLSKCSQTVNDTVLKYLYQPWIININIIIIITIIIIIIIIIIRSKMQAEQSILDRIQRRQLKWYEHLLRMEDSRWPKRFTSGHRTVGGEEEDHNTQGRTKWRTSWEAETWRNIRQMDIFGVWEWMDGS